jgi:hypothetical protein
MRLFYWHECATDAAFLCGVADDHITEARRRDDLAEICRTLDHADAALCAALRNLKHAREHAAALRQMMED